MLHVSDKEKVAAIRAELPAVQHQSYLNAGTNGPLPRRSVETLIAAATNELQAGRIGMATFMNLLQQWTDARAGFAELLGCSPEEIALTHNTTEGMNIALMGLRWQSGDEVITATTEHPGGLHPVFLLQHRYGVTVKMTEIGLADRDPVAELRQALTPRTKAVVLSHVCWSTGMVLPLRELADLAHEVGALLICDAAQACGMVPSKVYELGVDAYACSGQKWLCGPDGTGGLFVHKDRFDQIQQTYVGYGAVKQHLGPENTTYVPSEVASRYEAASLYIPALAALSTSMRWIKEDVGWNWAYARIAILGQHCYNALAAIDGVTMHSPRDMMAGLVHFAVDGIAPANLTAMLAERHILIRHTPYPEANRVATGFYTTEEEIDQLAEMVAELRKAG